MKSGVRFAMALALVFGVLGPAEAAAQQKALGVKAGFVSANVDEDGADSRTTLGFGAFAQLPVAEGLSVQVEALYLGKGFSAEDSGVESSFELTYLQIPVLLQYHFPVHGTVRPRLFAGPSVAFETGCDVQGSDGSVSASFSCEEFQEIGLDLETAGTDFGLSFGAGFDLEAGSAIVTLDGRYDLGLSEIIEIEGVSGVKHRAWEFFAGVGFPVGR